ncbi:MAG: hypothetical protein KAS96_01615 [Planctomycetes bacterium]|nr:hypothetical protein [Planctomycetota bacterium]
MGSNNNCFFCGSSKCTIRETVSKNYECKYCGTYILPTGPMAISKTPEIENDGNKFKIACVLNERRLKGLGGIALSDMTNKENKVCGYPQISAADILDEFPKKANDFLNRTLLNLSRLVSRPFAEIKLSISSNEKGNLSLFAVDTGEFIAFIKELEAQDLIRNSSFAGIKMCFTLTSKSWEMIDNLKNSAIDSKQAFVAMWFDKSMDSYYEEGIKKAVEEAGYIPRRIDSKDFNGKICDEIIAEIKRSKFLISDFTEQRGGVYFEAGYAMGQGKPVVFAVKSSDIDNLHFDTRQYNHITYDSPEDLRNKLYNRICATIV